MTRVFADHSKKSPPDRTRVIPFLQIHRRSFGWGRGPRPRPAKRVTPTPLPGGVDKPGETSQTDSPQSTGELLMTLRQAWWVAAVFAAATVPARAADDKKDEKGLIAHVALTGDLDEAPAGESIFGSDPGQNLKQKLDRIARAKSDPK